MRDALVIVPARGGSRRVPRKNVRPFLGVPAIARVLRTIAAAGIADAVVVSTDDDEIAAVARAEGAAVPFRRPADLADDHATTIAVVRHALDALEADGTPLPATTWVVYPTALLLEPEDLAAAADRFAASGARFLVALAAHPHPIERALRRGEDGRVHLVDPRAARTRTQDLPRAYHDAGQFYVGRTAAWRTSSPLEDDDTVGHVLDGRRVVDIDDEDDWDLAERLARAAGRTAP